MMSDPTTLSLYLFCPFLGRYNFVRGVGSNHISTESLKF